MTLLFRQPRTEHRAIGSVPWNVGDPLGRKTSEGTALHMVPVYSAIRLLCDSVSTLPLHSYRDFGDDKVRMNTLPPLLRLMADDGKLVAWLTQAMESLAARGNAVGLRANFNAWGFPETITWLPMDDVACDTERTGSLARPQWYYRGRRIDSDLIVHIPWIVPPGKVLALSPIEVYAATVGAGLKAQEFGNRWFDNGGVPPGTFRNEAQTITNDEADTIANRLVASIKAGRPLTYGKDWEYTPITIPPDHVQFIESQKLSATQIANIYGIDPTWIGGESGNSLTYANVEHRAIEYVTFALRPWLVRMEHGLSAQLPEKQYLRFNADALVRADLKTRYEVHKIAKDIGVHSVNDIRRLEDEAPIPGGDKYTTAAPPQAPGAPAAVPPRPQTPPPPEGDESSDEGERARLSIIHSPHNGGPQ